MQTGLAIGNCCCEQQKVRPDRRAVPVMPAYAPLSAAQQAAVRLSECCGCAVYIWHVRCASISSVRRVQEGQARFAAANPLSHPKTQALTCVLSANARSKTQVAR